MEAQSYEQAGKSKEIPDLDGLSLRSTHRSPYWVQLNNSSQSKNWKPGSYKNENNHHPYFSKSCSLVMFPEDVISTSFLYWVHATWHESSFLGFESHIIGFSHLGHCLLQGDTISLITWPAGSLPFLSSAWRQRQEPKELPCAFTEGLSLGFYTFRALNSVSRRQAMICVLVRSEAGSYGQGLREKARASY